MDIHSFTVSNCPISLYIAYTSGDGNDEVKPINSPSNRKDIATTFTRKLGLNSVPSHILPEHYTAVTTVVVMAGSSFGSDCFGSYSLSVFLGAIAKANMSSTPLHILFDGRKRKITNIFLQLLDYLLETPISTTQEFFDFMSDDIEDSLHAAHTMRAVLHVQPRLDDYVDDLTALSLRLLDLSEYSMEDYPGGRVYLCGVPDIALWPAVLITAGDKANDIAEITVFRHMSEHDLWFTVHPVPAWAHFQSHVEFVNPGFRPTLA